MTPARASATPDGRARDGAGSGGPDDGSGAPPRRATVADLRLLLPSLVGWSVVVVALPRPTPWLWGSAVGCVGLAILAWRCRARRPGQAAHLLALAALVTAVLLVAAAGHRAVRAAGPVPELAGAGAMVDVTGVVESDPRVVPPDQEHPTERVLIRVVVTRVTGRGRAAEVRTPILVVGGDELRSLHWWEHVRLSGRLRAVEPGEDIEALLTGPRQVRRLQEAGAVARVAEHVRGRLREAVQPLPDDPRGLLPALVIGDRSLTPAPLTDDMRATGMTHLSAVSGSNVAIVLAGATLLSRQVGLRRRWRPLAGAVVLVAFVVLARPDPSVLRAAVMGAVGLLGMTASRRAAGMPALGAAIVVLLVVDPWLARSFGFALSALATLGLLVFARPWGAALGARLPPRLRLLGEAAAVPLAAQAVCAPVLVLIQGSVTVVGIAANMLAAPLVAPATIAGVLCALAAAVSVPVATAVAWVAMLPAWGIAQVAHSCAKVPFGTLGWPDGTPGALLLAGVTLLCVALGPWLGWHARRHPLVALAVLVVGAAWWWPLGSSTWLPTTWQFVACDVGEADALVLATGEHHAVVVDAGEDPDAVDACLDRLAVEVVDALVLTHFHADHVRGMPGVLRGRAVTRLYVNPIDEPGEQARQVRQWAADAGLTPEVVQAGRRFEWGAVTADVLWPAQILHDGSVPNNASIVLDVHTPQLRALLLGDVEKEAARRVAATLATHPEARRFDVLKVAHHGSANLDAGLLRLVDAPVAVVSVGEGNEYGHPSPKTLDLLGATGATVRRTDRDGDIAVGVDDGRVVVGSRKP